MKLALHRSVTFWSGILVMAFICWAWRDSNYRLAFVQSGDVVVTHYRSAVEIEDHAENAVGFWSGVQPVGPTDYIPEWLPAPLFAHGGGVSPYSRLDGRITLREATLELSQSMSVDYRVILIPHWLILLAFALPWSALLAWRWRRRQRSMRES